MEKSIQLASYIGEEIRLEQVMNIIVTCTSPIRPGESGESKDGIRDEIWEIVGGRFEGKGIKGTVVPGGGDFPVVRPDGVTIVDALYRLKTEDGETIIIHNYGLEYKATQELPEKYRLSPKFTAPNGKYDWLNKHIFLSTLVEVPEHLALARSPDENDRMIQIFKVS